jgi:catechol 2,3-dioxygenase-like lactoylglutathione lyase family enzyme
VQSESSAIALPPPFKISVVVKDIDKTIEFLSRSVGLGPWEIFDFSPRKDELMMGEPFKIKVAWANVGKSLVYELHQPLEGRSVWSQFLETKGEGLHLLAYSVPSTWEEIVTKLQAQGAKMLAGGTYEGNRWCYLETRPGGIRIELTEETP